MALAGFQPKGVLPGVVAGLVVGLVVGTLSLSFAALIFAGELAQFLPAGIGIALFSSALVSLVIALFSSYPAFIGYPNDRTAPILALMAGSLVSLLPGVPPREVFVTVVAAVMVAAFATGACLTALGAFRLGHLVRFIPYPVFGGFLAGTGWLLVKGSLRVLTGVTPSFETAGAFFAPDAAAHWVPGFALAAAMLVVTRRFKHWLVMPAMLAGAVGAFYVVLLGMGVTTDAARAAGFLLGPFPASEPWRPLVFQALSGAHWSVVPAQAGSIGTVVFVAAVSVLLNASALELAAGREIDLDRELKTAGIASFAAGGFGGMPGFHVLSLSGLVLKMGVRTRVAGVAAAAVCAATLLAGTGPLEFVPKPVLGGVLMFLGFAFLSEWLWDGRLRLTRADYAVVLLILAVVATFGYLAGVGVGVVVCVALFALNYSRVRVVRHALSGVRHRSNVDRPHADRARLHAEGDAIFILKLQGYVFFGTAAQILETVQTRAGDASRPALQFAVLDFRAVSGIDTSAVMGFIKMRQAAVRGNFMLVFTRLTPGVRKLLEVEGFGGEDDGVFGVFPDLDHGIEWCEDRILGSGGAACAGACKTLADQLAEVLPAGADASTLFAYFSRLDAAAGEKLMAQGAEPDALYYLESGRLTVELATEAGESVRLRSVAAGTVVGEVGLYMGGVRTASVVAETAAVLWRLSRTDLERMEREAPDAAAAFHRFMARLLAERLLLADRTVADLSE
ncbi:MAG: SLC26A/SulP transporter family protein [Deltaproteobacteria bacterium]|nr:SLC26A/SulP transporter family protein [Deltaproteobacteria bacterium]